MLQVIGLPFIFIPISTLNYVGVPRRQDESDLVAVELCAKHGGSAGTALLTTYLARSAQVHQMNLASHLSAGSVAVMQADRAIRGAHAQLLSRQRSTLPFAQIYGQMQRQAMMLAYKNAFAILAGVVALLSPLVWIMRLPPKNAKVDPEQMAAH